jgi:NitT/TauT family transport system permease protein
MKMLCHIWQQKGRFAVPVFLLLLWEFLARIGYLPPALLPAPSRVFMTWGDWMFGFDESAQDISGRWFSDALASSTRVFAGYSIAALMGISMGVAIGWSKFVEKTIERCRCCDLFHPYPGSLWPSSGLALRTNLRFFSFFSVPFSRF